MTGINLGAIGVNAIAVHALPLRLFRDYNVKAHIFRGSDGNSACCSNMYIHQEA